MKLLIARVGIFYSRRNPVKVKTVVAPLVALIALFFSFSAAVAQDRPQLIDPPISGFVISDGTPCFAQVGDEDPWIVLAAQTDALVYTDPSEPWVLIGINPDENGSRNSCWTESAGISPGMGENPTEPEPTPSAPDVIPAPVAEPNDEGSVATIDETALSDSGSTVIATTLPITGAGPDDGESLLSFILKICLLAAVILGFFAGIPYIVITGCIDGYRDYKEGIDTPASRTLRKAAWFASVVLFIVRSGTIWLLSVLKRGVVWLLLHVFGAYIYCAERWVWNRGDARH